MIKDTSELPVVLVPCKYLSADFHRMLDEDYGRALKENGGHVTYTYCMEGESTPRWWERLTRFLCGRGSRDNYRK